MPRIREFVRRAIREPIAHFALIGALIFTAYAALDDSPEAASPLVIRVTEREVERLAATFEATWSRAPTRTELDGLIEDHVREEVHVREAIALGLDRDDTVIRRRLRQKMEFITDAGAEAETPGDATLAAYLDANRARFDIGPRVAFEQIFLGPDAGDGEAREAKAALAGGADPRELGAPTLLAFTVPLAPARAVESGFGPGFFERVAAAEPGKWTGPVASAYGAHLVRLARLAPGRSPELDEIRDKVEMEWRRERRIELADRAYQALRGRYTVELPEARPNANGIARE